MFPLAYLLDFRDPSLEVRGLLQDNVLEDHGEVGDSLCVYIEDKAEDQTAGQI